MARLTEHGFSKLGLLRISAGQHIELLPWQQKLELLGYKIEGIKQKGFIKGNEISDSVAISVIYENYVMLRDIRGKYWDSCAKMEKRIKVLPENSFFKQLQNFYVNQGEGYYNKVFRL
ncbi:MAG: hypothetical protein C0412_14025 [Flavobacterium sp.]|nr:hypothetical protein [Flavobacterium sp.]